jgi:hypothetical protein
MEKALNAVVAGNICLDIIPAMPAIPPGGFKETFLPGHLLEVGAAALSPGGAVSNTGLALRRLGIPAQLICKIGADTFGRDRAGVDRLGRPRPGSGHCGRPAGNNFLLDDCQPAGRGSHHPALPDGQPFLQPGEGRRYEIDVEFFESGKGAQ